MNVKIPQAPNISAGESGATRGANSNAETTDETTNNENTQSQGQVEWYVYALDKLKLQDSQVTMKSH